MNTTIIIFIVVGIIGLVFPIVAAVIVYRRGYPGWCVATILTIPLAAGWLVGILALMKPDKRGTTAEEPSHEREMGERRSIPEIRSSAIQQSGSKPPAPIRPQESNLNKGQIMTRQPNPNTNQGGNETSMGTGTVIFLGFCFLGILALVAMLGTISIGNMREDIATQDTGMLIMRLVFEFIFMSVFLSLVFMLLPFLKNVPSRIKIILSVGLVAGFLMTSYIVLDKSVQRLPTFDEQYWSAMQSACDGSGINRAAAYQPGTGIHKVVSITRSLYILPFEWLPTSLSDTQLVLCLGDEERNTIQTCQYTGNQVFARYQITRQASLVAVRSGEVIAETTFMGGTPGNCPNQISGSGSDTGSDVKEEDIVDWMRPYIER
jgi:hypothetical protein